MFHELEGVCYELLEGFVQLAADLRMRALAVL